ncbi:MULTISPECIES: hypothetical protein [Lysinibacillus]|nr:MULTISPECIES: hypothetical protein [Lysinibacillus]
MWVITVFEQNSYRMFQFENKNEATVALSQFSCPAILSFTS